MDIDDDLPILPAMSRKSPRCRYISDWATSWWSASMKSTLSFLPCTHYVSSFRTS